MDSAAIRDVAELLAAHALSLLLAGSALLLLALVLLWRSIERHAPRLVDLVAPLWRRLDRRRLAARYLGWHAAGAFVLAAAALAAFFELVGEIGADEPLARFDLAFAEALGRHLGPLTLEVFRALTRLGDPEWLFAVAGLVALVLFVRRETLLACSWIAGTGGGALLNRGLKALFSRERPPAGQLVEHGWSFPSGHASGSMLVYGLGAYLLIRHLPRRWHLPVAATAVLLVVFVGASRVLIQVHFASDVLAGWVVAGAWTALCVTGLEAVRLRLRDGPSRPEGRAPGT